MHKIVQIYQNCILTSKRHISGIDDRNANERTADFLEAAEHYHGRFIQNADIIKFRRQDIAEFDILLMEDTCVRESRMKPLIQRQRKLQKELKILEIN